MTTHVAMKDIAAKLGVSVMTVSRAFQNHPNVSELKRQQIKEAAEELGYRPNPMVSALMQSRAPRRFYARQWVLGFLTSFATRDGWRKSPFNREFFEGAVDAAHRQGYQIEEFWFREPRMNAPRLNQILLTRNIPGLLIAPVPVPHGHLRLDWEKFAAVALGHSLAWPPLHRVVDQQFHALRLALHQLRRRGYRRIGLALRAGQDQSAHHHWTGAFFVDQQSIKPGGRVPLLVAPDREWGEPVVRKWFQKYRPDAVLSLQEEVLDWIREWGCSVPEQVGFAHLDCPDATGRFAGVYHQGRALGTAAVDLLVGLIHRNERGIPEVPRWVVVESRWQDGVTIVDKAVRRQSGLACTEPPEAGERLSPLTAAIELAAAPH